MPYSLLFNFSNLFFSFFFSFFLSSLLTSFHFSLVTSSSSSHLPYSHSLLVLSLSFFHNVPPTSVFCLLSTFLCLSCPASSPSLLLYPHSPCHPFVPSKQSLSHSLAINSSYDSFLATIISCFASLRSAPVFFFFFFFFLLQLRHTTLYHTSPHFPARYTTLTPHLCNNIHPPRCSQYTYLTSTLCRENEIVNFNMNSILLFILFLFFYVYASQVGV